MLFAALTAALLATSPQSPPQDPPVATDAPVALEDITVTGRSLDTMIRDFVGQVAEPNRNRGLARWSNEICVGVANFRQEPAQFLADRVSTVAEDIGLTPGGPGCSPNILVIATDDGDSLAASLVDQRGRAFRMGGAGMDRGGAALRDFQTGSRAVRWWQLAMPVDSQTGQRAVRLPGECVGSCSGTGSAIQYAPVTEVFAASRVNSQIVDNLFRAIVIVDVDEVENLSILQLADYVAMVSLAQIDPEADTSAYASILNVLEDPESTASLTSWDTAYLQGLYAAERNKHNPASNRTEITRTIRLEHERLREDAAD